MDGARAVPTPAHIVLRESTRAAHAAAEAVPAMRRLVAGDLDESGYRGLLAVQGILFREWEERRGAWLAGRVVEAGWTYLSRARRLADDLRVSRAPAAAEAAPAQSRTLQAPRESWEPARLPEAPRDECEAWGELYVVEGSALGGRVIVKRLRQRFPGLPHHFYAIGEHAEVPWRRFQSVLDRVLAGPDALAAAVDGALRMFARFEQTLQDDPTHV